MKNKSASGFAFQGSGQFSKKGGNIIPAKQPEDSQTTHHML
jgi:hypothetical protein